MQNFPVFKSELTTLKLVKKFKLSNNSTVPAAAHWAWQGGGRWTWIIAASRELSSPWGEQSTQNSAVRNRITSSYYYFISLDISVDEFKKNTLYEYLMRYYRQNYLVCGEPARFTWRSTYRTSHLHDGTITWFIYVTTQKHDIQVHDN